MSPPGKKSGETTWLSVAMTSRPARHGQARLVVHLAQPRVVEGGHEELVDQLRHGAPAAAVAHVHEPALEVDGADVVLANGVHAALASLAGSGNRP